MKNRRYFLPLAVGLLTVVVTGGVIFAQNSRSQERGDSPIGTFLQGLSRQINPFNQGESGRIDVSHGDAPSQSMLSRVAVILGLEEKVVQDAFDQAHREKQDDSLANRLEHLVIDEKLTQAEADEILTWLLSRPEAAAKLNRQLLRGGDGMEHRLFHMMKRDVISQVEADEIQVWHDAMPQALKDLPEQRFHRSPASKAWGHARPSEGFQGWGTNRSWVEGRQFGREGFAGRGFRWGGMRDYRRDHMKEGAHGLDPAGTQ